MIIKLFKLILISSNMRYLLFLFLLLITVQLNEYVYGEVKLTKISCPSFLDIGEEGNLRFAIKNSDPKKVLSLTSFSILSKEIQNQTQNPIPHMELAYDAQIPIVLGPYNEHEINAELISTIERTYDLEFRYNYTATEDNQIVDTFENQEANICKISVISLKERWTDPIADLRNSLIFPFAIAAAGIILTWYFTRSREESNRRLSNEDRRKNEESSRRVANAEWLIKQKHDFYLEHYIHLVRTSHRLHVELLRLFKSNEISLESTKVAYIRLHSFFAAVNAFENSSKGLYFFLNDRDERKIKGFIQAIRLGLPFETWYLDSITHENRPKKVDEVSDNGPFRYFNSWIISSNCIRSKAMVINNSINYAYLLDSQGSDILDLAKNSESNANAQKSTANAQKSTANAQKSVEEKKVIPNLPHTLEDSTFYLFDVDRKVIDTSQGEMSILVRGNGFESKFSFSFIVGSQEITPQKPPIDNHFVEVKIPATLNSGTYDLYGKVYPTVGEYFFTLEGIVIHIDKGLETDTKSQCNPSRETIISGELKVSISSDND
jgi:hypothetical protein